MTPHYPSDHVQVVVQRPPLMSLFPSVWLLLRPFGMLVAGAMPIPLSGAPVTIWGWRDRGVTT